MANPFAFRSPVIQLPVSATSASNQNMVWNSLPAATDLTFILTNPNPFDIRALAIPKNADDTDPAFAAVTASTGVLVMARSMVGPFTSSKPVYVSLQAFPTAGQPLPDPMPAGCVVDIYYGNGE